MAVAYDAATETVLFDVVAADPFTFTHTPSGTPKGVLLFCMQDSTTTDVFTSASYGGVAMTAVSGGRAIDSAGEPMACKVYFLGASIPSGAQTVSIDHDTGVSSTLYAVCVSVTASGDTTISGTPVLLENDGTLSEQSVGTGAASALRFAGGISGRGTTPPPGANSTAVHDIAIAAVRRCAVVRETSAGTGSRPVGFSDGTSDDRAFVHLSVAETGGGGGGAVTRSFAVIVGQ